MNLMRPIPLITAGVAVAAAVTLAALTHAGPRGPEFPISVAEARERAEARFAELDSDGNGEISPDELAAAPSPRGHFGAFGPPGHHGPRLMSDDSAPADQEERRQAVESELFDRLDDNGDGQLSRDEFARREIRGEMRSLMQARLFERLDADGSGGLSPDELPDFAERLAAMDSDGNGVVTREEARSHRHARHSHEDDRG